MALLAIAALVFFRLAINSVAHTLPVSFLRLVPDADYLHLELVFNPFEFTFFPELDANKDGRLDPREWEAQQLNATRRMLDCLKVRVDGKLVPTGISGISPDFDSHHATLRAHYAADARRCTVSIESSLATLTSGSHFTQVTFGRDGGVQSARLDMQSTTATFESLEKNESSAAPLPQRNAALQRSQTAATVSLLVLGILPSLGILLALRWLVRRANRLHPEAAAEMKPVTTPEPERTS